MKIKSSLFALLLVMSAGVAHADPSNLLYQTNWSSAQTVQIALPESAPSMLPQAAPLAVGITNWMSFDDTGLENRITLDLDFLMDSSQKSSQQAYFNIRGTVVQDPTNPLKGTVTVNEDATSSTRAVKFTTGKRTGFNLGIISSHTETNYHEYMFPQYNFSFAKNQAFSYEISADKTTMTWTNIGPDPKSVVFTAVPLK